MLLIYLMWWIGFKQQQMHQSAIKYSYGANNEKKQTIFDDSNYVVVVFFAQHKHENDDIQNEYKCWARRFLWMRAPDIHWSLTLFVEYKFVSFFALNKCDHKMTVWCWKREKNQPQEAQIYMDMWQIIIINWVMIYINGEWFCAHCDSLCIDSYEKNKTKFDQWKLIYCCVTRFFSHPPWKCVFSNRLKCMQSFLASSKKSPATFA